MKSIYKIGDIVHAVDVRNSNMQCDNLLGLSMTKEFRPSTSNIVGTDLSKYKIVGFNQFAVDFMSAIRVHRMPIALNRTGDDIIVSPAYGVFAVNDESIVLPEYLMLWFSRSEFDRYADFKSDSAIRGGFDWIELCNTYISLPTRMEQEKIVRDYQVITNRIESLQKIVEDSFKLVDMVYTKWIERGQSPYRDGEIALTNENDLPIGWHEEELGSYIESYSKSHSFSKEALIFLNTSDILAGRFLTNAYMKVSDMPGQAKKQISKGDILFSEIRPANKRFALVRFDASDYVVSTKLMVLRTTQNKLSNLRIYHYLTMEKTLMDLHREADGKSGTFPQITFDDNLRHRKFVVANEKTEEEFNKMLKAHFDYCFSLQDEIDVLENIRSILIHQREKGV